jgi:hypothetical protein
MPAVDALFSASSEETRLIWMLFRRYVKLVVAFILLSNRAPTVLDVPKGQRRVPKRPAPKKKD